MTEFNEQKPTLYLIRGVSGSGKSTLAAQMSASMRVPFIEADMYFMENGVYLFNPLKLQEAHKWCQCTAQGEISRGRSVIVSNTSTTEKEVRTYQDIALQFGANFVSIIVENRNATESVHEVPDEVLQRQRSRFSVKL